MSHYVEIGHMVFKYMYLEVPADIMKQKCSFFQRNQNFYTLYLTEDLVDEGEVEDERDGEGDQGQQT